jgi:hypothetical protein
MTKPAYPKTLGAIEQLVRAARLAAEAAREEGAPAGLAATLQNEAERLALVADDLLYEARHGRVRWCRCDGHDGRYDLHEADRQRAAEEQRLRDLEAERRRREEAEASGEAAAAARGWV